MDIDSHMALSIRRGPFTGDIWLCMAVSIHWGVLRDHILWIVGPYLDLPYGGWYGVGFGLLG